MAEETKQSNPFGISEKTQEQAKAVVENAFRDLAENLRQLSDDLSEFNKRRVEMRGRMQDGARRTPGRIV